MIEQAALERPRFARVGRLEKRRRLNAAIKRVGVVRVIHDLPNLFEGNVRAFRKLDVIAFRIAPGLAKVIRRTQKRSPIGTVHRGPQPLPAVAVIKVKSIDAASGEIRTGLLPVGATAVRAKYEPTLHGSDEQ